MRLLTDVMQRRGWLVCCFNDKSVKVYRLKVKGQRLTMVFIVSLLLSSGEKNETTHKCDAVERMACSMLYGLKG